MKCRRHEAPRASNKEKSSADVAPARPIVCHPKASPVKPPTPVKPQCPPPAVTTVLFPLSNSTRAVHNKENSSGREHDRSLDEGFEDSGYLSLHNSQIDDHHGDEEDDHVQGTPSSLRPEKTIPPNNSLSECQGRTDSSCPLSLGTFSDKHIDHKLPILKFQQTVCEELAKSYRKNKRYDWSIVSKVAESHLLDRVIGGHMGVEYVDMLTSLLSRNMRSLLTNILALLGDMDLISCKKVSRTWRKIICEDATALSRCRRAEEAHRESVSSLRLRDCGLTRDVAVSRAVLSCMQTRASSNTPTSSSPLSSPNCRLKRQSEPTPTSKSSRFQEFIKATSSLKQHESLLSCKRCGSPAKHLAEAQRATCTHLNCLFDFCTRCKETFHGSTPCRTVQLRSCSFTSKTTPILPGSARSKRNIRRL